MGQVNRCDIAQQIDLEFGLTPSYLEDDSCLEDLTSDEAATQIESLAVTFRMLSSEFSPYYYYDKGTLRFTVQSRYQTGIITSTT